MPHRFGGYVTLMYNISDVVPSSLQEEDKLKVWKDDMLEEYMSIIKNNVWDIALSWWVLVGFTINRLNFSITKFRA
jgi:hypothetical protein